MLTCKAETSIGVDESRPVDARFSNPNPNISLSIIVDERAGIRKPVMPVVSVYIPQKVMPTACIENTMTPTL